MPTTELSQIPERTPIRLGRYEILQKLGVGGMADVYLACQPGPFSASKFVVIKQLRSGILDDEQFVQMFADESRIAVRLSHPNVVQTYEAVADGHNLYLVLEFLDGKSLYQVLTRATPAAMPLALHIWILTQVLTGLHYAHELKEFDGSSLEIVHRDVSPSNVFISYNGEVKLLDFGIAKSIGACSATREGIIKGKLGYAAPEQCMCKPTDRRTDLFAAGVMLWEAMAGRRFPAGETDASTFQARIQGAELGIEQVMPAAPAALVAICNRALARQPDDRFQTALEFRQVLERYLQSLGWDNGAERLHAFMHQHFAADVGVMKRHIDEYLGRSRSMGPNSSTSAGRVAPSLSSQYSYIEGSKVQGLPGDEAHVTAPSRRQLKRGAFITGAAVAVGLIAWFAATSASTNASGTLDTSHAPAGSESARAAEPVGAQAAEPISVTVGAKPDLAEVRLDGRQISNPYRAAHGRDKASHHLAVSCSGYETYEQDLQFDHDVDVSVALKALPQPQKDGASARVPRMAGSRVAGVRGSNRVTNSAAASVAQPGESLRAGRKTARIDETDPY